MQIRSAGKVKGMNHRFLKKNVNLSILKKTYQYTFTADRDWLKSKQTGGAYTTDPTNHVIIRFTHEIMFTNIGNARVANMCTHSPPRVLICHSFDTLHALSK